MKTRLLLSNTREQIGEPDLKIIPRIDEKIYYQDVMYKVNDLVHTPTVINILLHQLYESDEIDVEVDWE